MTKVISFQEALEKGLIQKGHYFQTVTTQRSVITISEDETGYSENQDFITEAGEIKLWRLVEVGQAANECKLFGTPTKNSLMLEGENGYNNGIATLDKIAAGTNVFPEFFSDVHSCRLPERDYMFNSWEKFCDSLKDEIRKYTCTNEGSPECFIAACFVRQVTLSTCVYFGILKISYGYMKTCYLEDSKEEVYNASARVCPEAIPRSNLLLKMEGCDGSKERPWVCVLAKEDT